MSRRLIAAVVAVLALTACGEDGTTPGATATTPPATQTPSATPSATASASVSPSPTATSTEKMRVPVYYLGGTQDRPVLFREFRSVPKSTGVVNAALDAMLHLAPSDSDYYSLWPSGTKIAGIATSGAVATVDLSANARSVKTTRAMELASLQQLVHTVTAAAPSITTVRLRFDGKTEPTLWGRVDTSTTLKRAAQIDTIAPIWVVEPALNAKVTRKFTVTGTAAVFEATVSWAVTRPGSSTQLAHGFVTATNGAPARGNFTVNVTLPAGTTGDVVFTAWESSAEDGRVTFPDSKTYRVG
ncbi:MAG TPA: Gmad2 immunoglobulin-like domain-containing protein [Frankiaceae bacterium]|nr:Gmad2 immunoglobulin-like domain-containing protein [Frankiaceae bacterium]